MKIFKNDIDKLIFKERMGYYLMGVVFVLMISLPLLGSPTTWESKDTNLQQKIYILEKRFGHIKEGMIRLQQQKHIQKEKKKTHKKSQKYKSLTQLLKLTPQQQKRLEKIIENFGRLHQKSSYDLTLAILVAREQIQKLLTDEQNILYLQYLLKNNKDF